MEELNLTPEQPFLSHTDELAFLRERLKHLEKKIESGEQAPSGEEPAHTVVKEYTKVPAEAALHKTLRIPEHEAEAIVLNLPPEPHDVRMAEFLGVLQERGVKNALTVVAKLDSPHLQDDFHRFLAEYIKEGYSTPGIKEREPLYKGLAMALYEVSLPHLDAEELKRELKPLISAMEQFYAGMRSVAGDAQERNHFTVEIAQPAEGEEVIFYVAVPKEHATLFEKHILGVFPDARVTEHNADYNIFNEVGEVSASYAELKAPEILPLRLYQTFDVDPLNVILNAFSKFAHSGEGAAVQLVVRPADESVGERFKKVQGKVQKGEPLKDALKEESLAMDFAKTAWELFSSSDATKKDGDKEKKEREKVPDAVVLEHLKNKLATPLFAVNLRVVASASDRARAEMIRHEIESSFNQFEEGSGNRLGFTALSGRAKDKLVRAFTFRLWSGDERMTLNAAELTTMVHFPASELRAATQLKRSKAGSAPAPLTVPIDGIVLGVNHYRETTKEIRFAPDDRLRHFYCIGQTGTGKTTLLKNMIVQDIKNGEGVCMIDPHGTDIGDVLANVPRERFDDVIYFDPAYTARPMALNMLEYDASYPEQKTFVVNELLAIFNKLFDMKVAGGPMFEQYFRNAALLVMEDPGSGNTLVDLSRVLAEKSYRELKLSRSKNPIVVQFWREVAEKAGGEASLQNIVPYVTSKFDVFLTNDIMRPVIAQEHSSFQFRRVMDEKKILLVNLSKGRLGDINANLIGLILVGKILMAALSRVDAPRDSLPPFYLYIDEFQNITTDSISSILSEARKYGLSLNIAHQFIKQLDEKIKDSVFGNVGSMCAFRTSAEDAETLKSQFEPVFSAQDIMNIDNRNAYLRLLIHGRPEKPFNIETLPPEKGDPAVAEELKAFSYQQYGRDRAEVEAEVMARYEKPRPVAPAPPTN
ncbi:TraM recognition domain-containing protein [Candidatus Wolfebacteria bacterium]|nr:TraM recognition domain-containing protein [Candidatus Wolfebacteria bacterium]